MSENSVYTVNDDEKWPTIPCNTCKHYKRGTECAAFYLIPDAILMGDNPHKTPLADQDNEIVYQPIKEV